MIYEVPYNYKLYEHLARLVRARLNCIERKNDEWLARHEEKIKQLVKDHMPSGSGIDSGSTIDLNTSTSDKLVFHTSFHHMNEAGYYDGWTEHTVIVRPSLISRFELRITGRNRNDIKDYLYDTFYMALDSTIIEKQAA